MIRSAFQFLVASSLLYVPHCLASEREDHSYLRKNQERLPSYSPKLDGSALNITSNFKITLMNMGVDTTYDDLFTRAARRWEQIIVGDLPDVGKKPFPYHDWFGNEWKDADLVNVDVDDVLIGYSMTNIDGRSNVLGFAGPVYFRETRDSISAISGIMKFDKEDFDVMPSDDAEIVILHEMGHVLGIGTFWHKRCGENCESGDSSYTCRKAKEEYLALGFQDELELESNVCGHWSEANFKGSKDEIMTPYFDENKYQPISSITCAALYDLGYEVNFEAADLAWDYDVEWEYKTNYKGLSAKSMMPSTSFVLNGEKVKRPRLLLMPETL